jgi:hypothetical protein
MLNDKAVFAFPDALNQEMEALIEILNAAVQSAQQRAPQAQPPAPVETAAEPARTFPWKVALMAAALVIGIGITVFSTRDRQPEEPPQTASHQPTTEENAPEASAAVNEQPPRIQTPPQRRQPTPRRVKTSTITNSPAATPSR